MRLGSVLLSCTLALGLVSIELRAGNEVPDFFAPCKLSWAKYRLSWLAEQTHITNAALIDLGVRRYNFSLSNNNHFNLDSNEQGHTTLFDNGFDIRSTTLIPAIIDRGTGLALYFRILHGKLVLAVERPAILLPEKRTIPAFAYVYDAEGADIAPFLQQFLNENNSPKIRTLALLRFVHKEARMKFKKYVAAHFAAYDEDIKFPIRMGDYSILANKTQVDINSWGELVIVNNLETQFDQGKLYEFSGFKDLSFMMLINAQGTSYGSTIWSTKPSINFTTDSDRPVNPIYFPKSFPVELRTLEGMLSVMPEARGRHGMSLRDI